MLHLVSTNDETFVVSVLTVLNILPIILKGGYNMLTKCKSFADAFIIQTCGNNKQLDYATPRSTNCACSAVFKQNRFNSA